MTGAVVPQGNTITAVDTRVTGKIFRQAGGGNVLNNPIGKRCGVQAKAPRIRRKNQDAVGLQ